MLLNDRDQIIAMTAEWIGERYSNGRPRVSDEKIEILKTLTQEEIWQPLYACGYRFQFQGDLKSLHPDKKLYGRAVTCCFMRTYASMCSPWPAAVAGKATATSGQSTAWKKMTLLCVICTIKSSAAPLWAAT